MAKYQRKPPVFDALQFTGGVANAKTIVEGVAALSPETTVRYVPASSEYGLLDGAVHEFKSPEQLRIDVMDGSTTWTVAPGDWVMVAFGGQVSAMTNAEFTAQYQPV